MNYKELVKKTSEELDKLEQEKFIELMKHRSQVASGAAGKESGIIGKLKREIAQIKMARGGDGRK